MYTLQQLRFLVAVVDCGHIVNPRTVEMQIESGVIYGLTAALYGEITIKNGAVQQGNFDDYDIHTMIVGSIQADGIWVFDSNWVELETPGYHFLSYQSLNEMVTKYTVYRVTP